MNLTMQQFHLPGMEAGFAAAERAAAAAGDQWRAQALDHFLTFARKVRQCTTGHAREYAESQGLPAPPDKRAWGAVVRAAKAQGKVKQHGFAVYSSATSHGRLHPLWVWTGDGQ